jgi:predicted transcriptional regulator
MNTENETTKQKILKVVQELPEELDIEDVMERLYLLYKIEKGLQQADAGNKVSHEEAKKTLKEMARIN